jgi:hypothetical protein
LRVNVKMIFGVCCAWKLVHGGAGAGTVTAGWAYAAHTGRSDAATIHRTRRAGCMIISFD